MIDPVVCRCVCFDRPVDFPSTIALEVKPYQDHWMTYSEAISSVLQLPQPVFSNLCTIADAEFRILPNFYAQGVHDILQGAANLQ